MREGEEGEDLGSISDSGIFLLNVVTKLEAPAAAAACLWREGA